MHRPVSSIKVPSKFLSKIYLRNSRDVQPCATAMTPTSVMRTHLSEGRDSFKIVINVSILLHIHVRNSEASVTMSN